MNEPDLASAERPAPLKGYGALPFPLRAAWTPALALLALVSGGDAGWRAGGAAARGSR